MIMALSLFTAGFLSLIISIVLARSVDVAEFGIYSMTVSIQSVMIVFSTFGMNVAVSKFVSEHRTQSVEHALRFSTTGLRMVLMFAMATSIVYFALAEPIGNGLYSEPGIVEYIPYSAIVVFSTAFFAFTAGVVQGNGRVVLLSLIQVSVPAICLAIIIVLLPRVGIVAAFLALFLAQSIVTIYVMYRLNRTGFLVLSRSKSDVPFNYRRTLLMFAVPAVLGAVVVIPLFWIGNTMLALYSDFQAVGYFAIAMVFFQALLLLPSSVTILLVPRVSSMSSVARDQVGPLVSKSVRVLAVVLFPVFFLIALFSDDMVELLYGSDYHAAGEVVYLMVTACYYVSISAVVGAAIIGLGRMWLGFGLNVLWGAIFLGFVLTITPSYGAVGLGVAFSVSYVIHLANTLYVSQKHLDVKVDRISALIILTSILFVAGFSSLADAEHASLVARAILLVVGSGMIAYMGRREYLSVINQMLRRHRISE